MRDRERARWANRLVGSTAGALLLVAALAGPGLAQDEEYGYEIHGFALGCVSGRTTGIRPAGGRESDFVVAEERLRLEIEAWVEAVEASATVKADFLHDAVAGEVDVDLREAYIDYTVNDFDFRLGRQVVTWGVGDLLFIDDVFPKDWVSFFAGRPLEYLKIGVDGLRITYSSDAIGAELVAIPSFTPDRVPSGERFFLFDPFASVASRDEEVPDLTYDHVEFAFRCYRTIAGIDVSAYAYRGFWRTPSMRPDDFSVPTTVTAFYPALSVYGLSAQASALGGVVGIEGGYYHSREDENGDDPVTPNSQARFLVGYQMQPWEDATVGVQYYAEIMEDHAAYDRTLPPGFPAREEYRDIATLRFEQLLAHQTWRLSLMGFYSPADNDYLVQPQATYKISDNLAVTVGASIFGGERGSTAFGQLDGNDDIYLTVRFDF